MIPKTIHCCWFSGERKSALVRRCMESWRMFAPDFEIREWDVLALREMTGGVCRLLWKMPLKRRSGRSQATGRVSRSLPHAGESIWIVTSN